MGLSSFSEIIQACKDEGKDFFRIVLEAQCKENGCSEEDALATMRKMWASMREADSGYKASDRSASGLSGGDGKKFEDYAGGKTSVCGPLPAKMIATALKMAESNACMKRIVASPTAGSCGVLPAVLIPLFTEGLFDEENIIRSLFVAAGTGQVIASRATISGAEGGCQAEVGSASAMAAAALVFLKGGTAEQVCNAAGFALQNLLGLVCDPVAGLVEVPCVKRNVIGVMNALSCADMALAGLTAHIPADEIVDAMKTVGRMISTDLRETGRGGLAATPWGREFARAFF
ncbi:MAG: L-serine ammonia-lyase, iron-sulfur-dependent, subunit alpha [Treponema sp.]|nr:L-serine ammonia-lyase, iron-sulfur-dependent, subunit alpha [Treponema sp.]